MSQSLKPNLVDPHYVQVSKQEAAAILCISVTEFDRMRKRDERCPQGFKRGTDRLARVYFRLSDVYAFSEALIEDAQAQSRAS